MTSKSKKVKKIKKIKIQKRKKVTKIKTKQYKTVKNKINRKKTYRKKIKSIKAKGKETQFVFNYPDITRLVEKKYPHIKDKSLKNNAVDREIKPFIKIIQLILQNPTYKKNKKLEDDDIMNITRIIIDKNIDESILKNEIDNEIKKHISNLEDSKRESIRSAINQSFKFYA